MYDIQINGRSDRLLSIYTKLLEGQIVNKDEEARIYNVDKRTIQRDLADIRCFFQNQVVITGENNEIVFDRNNQGYRLRKF